MTALTLIAFAALFLEDYHLRCPKVLFYLDSYSCRHIGGPYRNFSVFLHQKSLLYGDLGSFLIREFIYGELVTRGDFPLLTAQLYHSIHSGGKGKKKAGA
jgi:hypothetical protein